MQGHFLSVVCHIQKLLCGTTQGGIQMLSEMFMQYNKKIMFDISGLKLFLYCAICNWPIYIAGARIFEHIL